MTYDKEDLEHDYKERLAICMEDGKLSFSKAQEIALREREENMKKIFVDKKRLI